MSSVVDRLLKNTAIYAIGNFGSKIILFALVPIVSFFLTKKELGEYDLVQTMLNLTIPLFTVQISNGVYRWLLDKKENIPKEIVIVNGMFVSLIGWGVFVVLYLIAQLFFNSLIPFHLAFFLFGFSMIFQFFQFVVRGIGRTQLYSISGVVNSIGLLFFTFIFLKYYFRNVEGLYVAIISANFLASLYLFVRGKLYKFIKWEDFDKGNLRKMLRFSLPLIPNQISWWLISASDKFIILIILSSEMNGIYAISSRFPAIMTLVNSIFILAWQDYTLSDEGNDKQVNTRLFKGFMRVQFSMVLLLIPLSEPMVIYLVDEKFYESYKYMPLLFLGVCFSSLAGYFGAVYLRSKNTTGILTTSIIGGLINLAITLILMKWIGLYASALGTFVSFFAMVMLRIKGTKRMMPIIVPYTEIFVLTVLSLIYCVMTVYFDLKINLMIFILTIGPLLLLNNKLLVKIKNYLIK